MTLATLDMTSSAFMAGEQIPRRHAYLGEGRNISPPLDWPAPPRGTVEQVLVCEDPDAPGEEPWVHWVLYGIPPQVTSLGEGQPNGWEQLERAGGARQGLNSWGEVGWGGPLPPSGHGLHRYHFRLYALDRPTGLSAGASLEELRDATRGHILGRGELIGTYER